MSACYTSNDRQETEAVPGDAATTHRIVVALSDELVAAVEGWRKVHGVEQSEAIGTLVRLGLLGEIAKIYRFVSSPRSAQTERGHKRQRASAV